MGDEVCLVWERERERERERVHARMMLVHSNIHRESTTQAKGAAKTIIVVVVATQELKAGNLLRRFKAEAAPDEPGRGNNNDRYICKSYIQYIQ